MPIFTAIVAAIGLTGFFATAVATVLEVGTAIGLSYAAKALAGTPATTAATTDNFSTQGAIATAGDVPRSFNVGYSVTAGSLVYVNTWGTIQPGAQTQPTPNAYLTQVIALSDLPGGTLQEFWVNGALVTINSTEDSYGFEITEYTIAAQPYLWIRYYDGTQTTADTFLTGTVSSADRPYDTTRIGKGIAYVVVTSLVNDTLWTGFPTYKFALSGIPLYDPTKDDTNGGSGAQRYSDPTTWGGDGDQLPAVQIYNILRGFSYGGAWMYGLQNATAARLPALNWNAQIDKCRATITGVSGPEATYRSGVQISIDTQPVNAIETLLTACQGKLSEIGGFYKIHLGTPDTPSFSFTDDDILSTEIQTFTPFFGLADSINGITGSYPDPTQGWNTTVAPAQYDATFEAQDGNRRLLANPTFDAVPYAEQVQRLMSSALAEARRARQHAIVMPPEYWIVEPGDVGTWTSARNGYSAKQFRVDGTIDQANLDTAFSLTEVDPTDYDWDHSVDFTAPTSGPTISLRPAPQGIVDWSVAPATLTDADGISRRPAIAMSWDGNMPGVVGVQYQVRKASDQTIVTGGRTDQLAAGTIIISQSLLPDFAYEVQGQYLPSSPRDMLWSDWLPVTTPNVLITAADLDASIVYQYTTVIDQVQAQVDDLNQRMSTLVSQLGAQGWTDIQSVRSQLSSTSGAAMAAIGTVSTVATDAASAVADLEGTVSAQFGTVDTTITEHTTAIATLDGYAAGSWGVVIDVDGNVVGAVHLDGSAASSVFGVTASTFQVSAPGVSGGAAVPVFTIASVGGVNKIALLGDMIVDGSITTQKMTVTDLSSITADLGTITTGLIQTASGFMTIDMVNERIIFSDNS